MADAVEVGQGVLIGWHHDETSLFEVEFDDVRDVLIGRSDE